jgi:hypothetical protein
VSATPSGSLPPIIRTSDPDSFAAFTFRQRLPAMLDQICDKNGLCVAEATPLIDLKKRLQNGTVDHFFRAHSELADHMEVEEHAVWNREVARHEGRAWLDLPWYFAESLFYLEVLLAWGYYEDGGPRFAVDPYQPFKEEELSRSGGGLDLAVRIARETGGTPLERRVAALLHYGLWSNRLDLSYSQLLERYRNSPGEEPNRLLVDHTSPAVQQILRARRVDMILDNSGSELVADLALAHTLLQYQGGLTVILHCKSSPYYVSDATAGDVHATIRRMEHGDMPELQAMGRGLSRQMYRDRLVAMDHFFWNGPLHFTDFPQDLRHQLEQSDLIVLKGDLNYRRLLADRRWEPSTPMEAVVAYFPAPLLTLRTTKSELVVDLSRETAKRLDRDDPEWRVQGRYGIIRYCDPPRSEGSRNSTSPLTL